MSSVSGQPASAAVPREALEADVVFVGAGVASLSAAYRLLDRARRAGLPPPQVLVFEKGRSPGAHVLSGAVIEMGGFDDLLGERAGGLPVAARVTREAVFALTPRRGFRLPWIPPPMRSRGLALVSLGDVTAWLAAQCEEAGAEIYSGTAAASLLREGGRVTGVVLGDHGLDREGRPKSAYLPGAEVRAKAVVLGEGACGLLTSCLVREYGLDRDVAAQAYALGFKELFEMPPDPAREGMVLHTFGFPLDRRTYGGGFVYGLSPTRIAAGLVIGLDYRDPALLPHECFRAFKAHPLIRRHLEGGRAIGYGAKLLPEGGLLAVPGLAVAGALILGDGAGLVDSVRLKGVHLAVGSGAAAGDALFDALGAGSGMEEALASYPARLRASPGWSELRRVRHVRGAFRFGLLPGVAATGLSWVTRGLLPAGRRRTAPDREGLRAMPAGADSPPAGTGSRDPVRLALLDDLFLSGTQHEEDQLPHVAARAEDLCARCRALYGAPCTRFCPGQVYEWDREEDRLRLQPSNCLHCRACRVKCPFDNVEWTVPEGGGGPRYRGL